MRHLFRQGYNLGENLMVTFARLGYWFTPETRILDYGCGSGGLVYTLRDLGFDAYGFDIHERVSYRQPEDRRLFGFISNPVRDTSNAVVPTELYRVPFEDNFFDVVVSTSVIEHVQDLSAMMGEVARVLKPTGCTLHVYPRRTRLIEPHMYVPLGCILQNWWWFYLWGILGLRNEYQEKMTAREVADRNLNYSKVGLKYLSQKDLYEVCGRFFHGVRNVDDAYNFAYNAKTARRNFIAAFKAPHPIRALSLVQTVSALFTDQKIVR